MKVVEENADSRAKVGGRRRPARSLPQKEPRQERIAALKSAVESNSYEVDSAELSKKIIDAHLTKAKSGDS